MAGMPANWLIDSFGECSPIDIASKIMKLRVYYAAKNAKFTAYSLILIGRLVFIQ